MEFQPHFPSAPPSGASRVGGAGACLATTALAWATVTGVLIGLGRRHGTIWQPLNVCARALLGDRAESVFGFHADVTLVGGAVVLVMSAVAACATVRLTSSRTTLHSAMTAAGVALAGYLVHLHIVARTPGGLAAFLEVGELRALYAAAAIALLAGMRYAFSAAAGALPDP